MHDDRAVLLGYLLRAKDGPLARGTGVLEKGGFLYSSAQIGLFRRLGLWR